MKIGEMLGAQSMPVPAGMYPVEVSFAVLNGEVIKVKDSGDSQFSMPMKISGGDYDGQVIWANFTLTHKAIWTLGQFLQQIGYDEGDDAGDPFEQDDAFMEFIGTLDGMRFQVEVTCEEVMSKKQGKMISVNKVINYFPQGSAITQSAGNIMGAKPIARGTAPGATGPSTRSTGTKGTPPSTAKAPTRSAGPQKAGKTGPSKPANDMPAWAKGPVGGDPIDGETQEAGSEEAPF